MGRIGYGARTQEEIEARRGGRSQVGAASTVLTAIYETDPEVVAAVLPPPLQPGDESLVRVTVATVDLGGGMPLIGAGTFAVQARHAGVLGSYPLFMPMSTEQAVTGGREVYGEPKKLAELGLERQGEQVRGWVSRMGATLIEIEGSVTGEPAIPPEEDRVDFYFKFLPSPDGKGFDSDPALVHCHRVETTTRLESVDGRVILRSSPFDPVADLPVRTVRRIELGIRSSTQRGEIVERVPGEWIEPFVHQRYDERKD